MTAALVTEQAWQRTVTEAAELHGWVVCHVRRTISGHGKGWVTGTTLKGWPDLTLLRPPRIVFAELKSATGRVSAEQQAVLDLLDGCPGVETYVWRPDDWDDVVAVLR